MGAKDFHKEHKNNLISVYLCVFFVSSVLKKNK